MTRCCHDAVSSCGCVAPTTSRFSPNAPTAAKRSRRSSSTSRTSSSWTSRCRGCPVSKCSPGCRSSRCRWWCSLPRSISTPCRRSDLQYKPDLIFLDIQMPGMSGFEVLARLPQQSMPVVVFVTAFDQYAMQAFEARAIDYLLKPIDDARFEATVTRVREHVRARSAADQRDRLMHIIADITGCGQLAMD